MSMSVVNMTYSSGPANMPHQLHNFNYVDIRNLSLPSTGTHPAIINLHNRNIITTSTALSQSDFKDLTSDMTTWWQSPDYDHQSQDKYTPGGGGRDVETTWMTTLHDRLGLSSGTDIEYGEELATTNRSDLSKSGKRRRGPPGEMLALSPHQLVSKTVKDNICFVFSMVLIPCFALFGSVGNILSLRVLMHHRMRSSTNMVLAALAVSDLAFLLHCLYFAFLRFYTRWDARAGSQLRALTFPILGPYSSVITGRITTGLTTMLSVERLVAVYFPMKAKVMCSRVMTATCILLIYLLTALAFVPMTLKYHSYYRTDANNVTTLTMNLTTLGQNKLFYNVFGNLLNVLFRLLPICVLVAVNCMIVLAIRRTWSIRRSIARGSTGSGRSTGRGGDGEQTRITQMLLMVSTVFLVCILPGAVHSLVTQIDSQYSRFGLQSNLYEVMAHVTYFLETVNSSVNFIIYMAFSAKFKHTYRQIYCCVRADDASQRTSIRSVVRFPTRAHNGSKSSSNSYKELYPMGHYDGKKQRHKSLTNGVADIGNTSGCSLRQNGTFTASTMIVEENGRRVFRSKYSSSEASRSSSSQAGEKSSQHSVHSGGDTIDPSPHDMYS